MRRMAGSAVGLALALAVVVPISMLSTGPAAAQVAKPTASCAPGDAQAALGRLDDALTAYAKALEADPTLECAVTKVKELCASIPPAGVRSKTLG